MKQPVLGIVATAIIIAISLGFISLFDFPMFSGWVTFLLACIIPMEIVVGVVWGTNYPGFAASRNQPVKGLLLVLSTLLVGFVVAAVCHSTVGGAIAPPTPMLSVFIIASVVIMFWFAIMFGGWPFTTFIKNPVAAGLTMVVACYLMNYALFRVFFDFGFMQGAPVYVAAQDPHGLFNANSALVFYVTAVAILFLLLHFDLWPFTLSPSLMKQPVLGIVWTILALVLGGIAFYIGVAVRGRDPMSFLVSGPVPFIFGTIVVLNMLQGSVFAKFKQPLKGVLNTLLAAVVGIALARFYILLEPTVTGPLSPGAPGYDHERWIASALLAVTFPFLIFCAEFFKMWPLQKAR
jgi:hypothetical protein